MADILLVRACCCTRTQCVRALAWKINVDNDDAIFVSRVYYELLVAHGIHVHRRLVRLLWAAPDVSA